ncbi:hypothetical protein [Nonomuraea sp. B1E8]|uniref:hypothetical protein n=1 Tax=unclassified Nonomuraea TaxID=2593643 RepID=UPI00325CABB5
MYFHAEYFAHSPLSAARTMAETIHAAQTITNGFSSGVILFDAQNVERRTIFTSTLRDVKRKVGKWKRWRASA